MISIYGSTHLKSENGRIEICEYVNDLSLCYLPIRVGNPWYDIHEEFDIDCQVIITDPHDYNAFDRYLHDYNHLVEHYQRTTNYGIDKISIKGLGSTDRRHIIQLEGNDLSVINIEIGVVRYRSDDRIEDIIIVVHQHKD